ncbi:MAG: glycosyltransferase family 2 protein [Ignavibacteria bacterium]
MTYVIIPNLNGASYLKTCLDSLFDQSYSNLRIIIVDNNSSDNSVNFIKSEYPPVKIIILNENFGFSKAVNKGIKFAISENDCDNILLLNNDTECDKFMITEMLKALTIKGVGSVACKMLNFYERNRFDETGHYINKHGFPHKRGYNEIDLGQYDVAEFVFGACAGAALFKKEIFEKVGFFDEDFFAYYEDVDLNMRMQIFGFKCFYNPKAVCYHMIGATSSKFSSFKLYLMERNLTALMIKNFPSSVLPKYFIMSNILRIKSFVSLLFKGKIRDLVFSLKGYYAGIITIPKNFKKRKKIYKNNSLSANYFESFAKTHIDQN